MRVFAVREKQRDLITGKKVMDQTRGKPLAERMKFFEDIEEKAKIGTLENSND